MELMNQKLLKLFEYEANNEWYSAFGGYKDLCSSVYTPEVAIHHAFFCWYMLWQWDEMVFPGETLSLSERITVDIRGGISKSELNINLNRMTQQLLLDDKVPAKYIAVLVHIKRIFPYFFKADVFSDEKAEELLTQLERTKDSDFMTIIICAYQRNANVQVKSEIEKHAIMDAFLPNSLISTYFKWLFDR